MPRATVSRESERFELETCEGGFVELRRMSYEAFLTRQDIMMRLQLDAAEKGEKRGKMSMSMGNKETTVYEYKECVVDHNLEDDEGNKLDLTKPTSLKILDPKIGQEISDLIQNMNQHLSEESLGN